MAITLAADIARDSNPLQLAGGGIDGGAIGVQIDDEQCRLVRPGESPLVVRGWNGTGATGHAADTVVSPLYLTVTSTPGGGS